MTEPGHSGQEHDLEEALTDRKFTFQSLRTTLFGDRQPSAVTVRMNDSLTTAVSIMMRHDFSQLPVVRSQSECRGAVSWESIARTRSYRPEAGLLDCTLPVDQCSLKDDVLDNLPRIMTHGFVVLKDDSRRIAGVVTVSDITEAFGLLTGPFLRLGQVETRLRKIARDHGFPIPASSDNKTQEVDDLVLGDLKALFDNDANWNRLRWDVDRAEFRGLMGDVVQYRNIVMHFRTPHSGDPDESIVQNLAAWLDRLEPRGPRRSR